MLSEKSKQIIRDAYKTIGDNLPNFSPRKQQTLLIAEIAKTLAGEYSKERKIITIEAGTGTGKSLAYSLSTIPLALARKKQVIISTATVALQEQLVDKDLPFLQQHAGLKFAFTLVKGRQRYVCKHKLAIAAGETSGQQTNFTFSEAPKASDIKQLKLMYQALTSGKWQGDIDSWPKTIAPYIWQQIQSDKYSCLRHIDDHKTCPFHLARDTMEQANVLVINHSLLLADLELGGGKILPEPDDCFYVIDEAHHLPQVARDFSSATATIVGATEWLAKLVDTGNKIGQLIKRNAVIGTSVSLADDSNDLINELKKVHQGLIANQQQYFAAQELYRFKDGIIPKHLKTQAQDITQLCKKSLGHINKLYNLLMEATKDQAVKIYLAEPLLSEAGFMIHRLENLLGLWQMYARTDSEKSAPTARWLEKVEGKKNDIVMCASPIDVGFMLEDMLWSKCSGAVLCSATIRALNSFDHFRRQAGLSVNDGSQYLYVDSPFNYQQNALLIVPNMDCDASEQEFTNELIAKLPEHIGQDKAVLVLFSSYWQMEKVAEALRKDQQLLLQVQGETSRQQIIKRHCQRIDNGKQSIVFGTQSFSEGLDLPGKYLTNLIITKLPFSVPTSPVEEAHAEYISAKGGNPFMSLSVPQASRKLIQACGRLLRNEQDTGKITIMDKRIITKRYGQDLINALPPFKKDIRL